MKISIDIHHGYKPEWFDEIIANIKVTIESDFYKNSAGITSVTPMRKGEDGEFLTDWNEHSYTIKP